MNQDEVTADSRKPHSPGYRSHSEPQAVGPQASSSWEEQTTIHHAPGQSDLRFQDAPVTTHQDTRTPHTRHHRARCELHDHRHYPVGSIGLSHTMHQDEVKADSRITRSLHIRTPEHHTPGITEQAAGSMTTGIIQLGASDHHTPCTMTKLK